MEVITVEMYKCSICKKTHTTKKSALSCQVNCRKKAKENEKRKKAFEKSESIRLTATSLKDIFVKLNEYLREYHQVRIDFDSYPSRIGMQSITHNAPIGVRTSWTSNDSEGKPTSYLAFTGRWEGTVFNLDGTLSSKTFGELIGTFSSNSFRFLHTGTGSSGTKFSIDGCMFLQDFPIIHSKYELFMQLKRVKEDIELARTQAIKTHAFNLNKAITEDPDVLELKKVEQELLSNLSSLRGYISEVIEEKRVQYEPDFKHLLEIQDNFDEVKFNELKYSLI
jgi:hypothetical protein